MAEFKVNVRVVFAGEGAKEAQAAFAKIGREGVSAIDRVGGRLKALEQGIGKVKGVIASVGALTIIGPQALQYLQRGIDLAGQLALEIYTVGVESQNLRARLVTALQGDALAGAAFERLSEFATRTPFELQGVVQAFTTLVSAGIAPTERRLTAFGNLAGAWGQSIEEMSQAVAKSMTGEFERLEAFGVRIRVQGDKLAVTSRGQTEVIERDSAAIIEALTRIGEAQYAGGMERQAATVSGALSNLQDATSTTFETIARESGLLVGAEALFRALGEAINDNRGLVGGLARALGEELVAALQGAAVGLGFLVDYIERHQTTFSGLAQAIARITGVATTLQALDVLGQSGSYAPSDSAARKAHDFFEQLKVDIAAARVEQKASQAELDDYLKELEKVLERERQRRKLEEERAKAQKEAEKRLKELLKLYEKLRDKADPIGAANRELAEGLAAIKVAIGANIGSTEEWARVEKHLRDEWTKTVTEYLAGGEKIEKLKVRLYANDFGPLPNPDNYSNAPREQVEFEIITDDSKERAEQRIEDVGHIFASFLYDSARTGEFQWEQLWQSFVDLAFDAITEVAIQWAKTKFVANVTSGSGGSGATGAAAGAGTTAASSSSAWSSLAPVLGTAAIFAAVYYLADKYVSDKRAKRFGVEQTFGVNEGVEYRGTFDDEGRAIAQSFSDLVRSVELATGALVQDLPEIGVRIRADGKRFAVTVGDAYLGTFRDVNEAITAGLQQALRTGRLEDLDEEYRQVLAHQFASAEELLRGLEDVRTVLDWDSTPFVRSMEQALASLGSLEERLRAMGVVSDEWSDYVEAELLRLRRQATGQQEDPSIEQDRNVAAFERLAGRLRQQFERELERLLNTVIRTVPDLGDALGEGAGTVAGAVDDALGALGRLGGGVAIFGAGAGRSAEEIAARIREIQEILNSEAFRPIDPEERRPTGGGGGRRRQDRERLADLFEQADLDRLNAAARALAEINRRWDEALRLARGNADAVAQIEANRQAEIDRELDRQLGTAASTGPQGQLAEILAHFGQLLDAFGTTPERVQRIRDGLTQALAGLGEGLIDGLSLPLESVRDRITNLQEVLAVLQETADQGALPLDRFRQVISELAGQLETDMLGLARSILDAMGATERSADVQVRLRQAEFEVQRLQLNMLYRAAMAADLITGDMKDWWDETIQFINDPANRPNFSAEGPGAALSGSSSGLDGAGSDYSEINSELERAREILASWQQLGLSDYQRDMAELADQYDLVRRRLGNTMEVQAAYALALADLRERYLADIRSLRDSIRFGDAAPITDEERYRRQREEFERVLALVNAGDLGQADNLANIGDSLLSAYAAAYGTANRGGQGTPGYAALAQWIDDILSGFLDAPGAAAGAVAPAERTASAVEALHTDTVRELQGLRDDVRALGSTFTAAGGNGAFRAMSRSPAPRSFTIPGSWRRSA